MQVNTIYQYFLNIFKLYFHQNLSSSMFLKYRYVELESMQEFVGPAATFISYAQKGLWGDLVAAILDGNADFNRKVWIDIFAVRQWPSDNPDLDFASTIQHCDSFLCVCSYVESVDSFNWWQCTPQNIHLIPASDRQKIAFLRVWCLVEIAAAARKGPEKLPVIMKVHSYTTNRLLYCTLTLIILRF